ncbi:hypothetical protein [Noviherbaspirillum autotrophicum]|uniref:Uncharacterized protein n=1 Tax=Noviherbaspirillum autotrophicum TaxID=709839 RepID=A0A0C2BFU5_9BURK|nr:hypothetical protein [Noviherbaspirillum autotrophicum]KIF80115.1 hypothetical protein TSA66_03725 [Noviherbaspirillum autotrophicum]
MQHYYVDKKETSNGDHEVHVPRCEYLPEANDRIYLGAFSNCGDAVRQAKSHYGRSTGCRWCCGEGRPG